MTILVADHDGPFRCSIARLLTAMGYRVEAVPSARELFARPFDDIDCFLIDLSLPIALGRTAQDVLRELRRHAPALLITGSMDDEGLYTHQGVTPHDCLVKPFTQAQLQDALTRAMGCTPH